MIAVENNALRVRGTSAELDLLTLNDTETIMQVPAGYKFYMTHVLKEIVSTNAPSGMPVVSIGSNATSYNNWTSTDCLVGYDALGKTGIVSMNTAVVFNENATIVAKVNTAGTGTAWGVKYTAIGYYVAI